MKKRLITLHGISTNGEWQERVEEVFSPHFDYMPIKYPEYRHFGGAKVILGVGRKKKALERITRAYVAATADQAEPPHLIAHSLGTVLSATLLKRFPWVRLDRVVFVGSPLPADFNWDALLAEDPAKFQEIRNETGAQDWVVRAAGLKLMSRRGLGDAGLVGFFGRGVHPLLGPLQGCSLCVTTSRSNIHNAPLRDYGHSTMFLSERHAADLWLPFLWGLVPQEYLDFIRMCQKVRYFQEESSLLEAESVKDELKEWRWQWAEVHSRRVTLAEYVRLNLISHFELHGLASRLYQPQALAKLEALALQGVCEAALRAVQERNKIREEREPFRIQALHPRIAVLRAVKELVELLERRSR